MRQLIDGREILLERSQGGEPSQKGSWGRRFYDEPLTVLAENGIFSR